MMRFWKRSLSLLLALVLLSGLPGCGGTGVDAGTGMDGAYVDQVFLEEIDLEDESVALASSSAALTASLTPVASGIRTKKGGNAVIDYSNAKDGYVMAKSTGTSGKRIKVQVAGPSYDSSKLIYTYDLPAGAWATFPLSDGSGKYKVTVLENVTGSKYAQVTSASFQVELADEFAPFLRPNQYVDYGSAPDTVAMAAQLVGGEADLLKKVEKIYSFVVKGFTYDYELAASVKSGYLPVLDSVLASRKGICFDYAALMAGMLRSQGVPCKLVTGYVPTGGGRTVYHAWISVWSQESGWIEGTIYFDGSAWQRMDPTFASTSGGSDSILEYIGNGSNYALKYCY